MMIDKRADLSFLACRLESILVHQGILAENGQLMVNARSKLPTPIEDALNGFIENPTELMGLLNVCRDARDGRPLSPAVMMAAHLMAREVLEALGSTPRTKN